MWCAENARNAEKENKVDFKIYYPANRNPYIHYRDPKRHIWMDNGRISVIKLNLMLRNPLPVIRDERDCEFIARCGIYEGLRDEVCRTGGKKFKVIYFCDFIYDYWDYEKSQYLTEKRELEGRETRQEYCKRQQSAIKTHVLPIIDKKLRLDEFTPQMMKDIQLAMRTKGLKAKTINRVTGAIKAPLSVAYSTELIKNDVAGKIHNLALDSTERGVLTLDEITKLLLHLKGKTQPMTYDRWKYLIVAIGFYSGMRLGEIVSLELEELDTELNTVRVMHTYSEKEEKLTLPKCGKTRETFPIPMELMQELTQYATLNDGGFIFPSIKLKDIPMRQKNVDRMLSKALEEIGISKEQQKERVIVFHSLRHTFTSVATGKGIDRALIQQSLGHSTMAMTQHYTHETEEARKNFAKATAGVIEYISEEKKA